MEMIIRNVDELPAVAAAILSQLRGATIILLNGDLGAGKTSLTKAICALLGVTEVVTSPTFSIINTHASLRGPVHHMDLYRLDNRDEAVSVGLKDYLHSGEICIIEWPHVAMSLIPRPYLEVRMATGHNGRHISLTHRA